jgi:predicted naringenin-chalcone synthase
VTVAHLNRIATAVPRHEVHQTFIDFARTMIEDRQSRVLFARMVEKAQIEHRFSCLEPAAHPEGPAIDAAGRFRRGAFPGTADRMRIFEREAGELAVRAVEGLDLGQGAGGVTHLLTTCCTGFSAPGFDLDVIARCGLDSGVERSMIGFMGCQAAVNALRLARHIVRSEPAARVLVVNLELCTLHLQERRELEPLLSFLVFGDGCAAALVSAEPVGLALDRFRTVLLPGTAELITWKIRELGFDMALSGRVPGAIGQGLRREAPAILDGAPAGAVDLWAVHPGGRSVLDAVERALDLAPEALGASRRVLRRCGNMSSATLMFVLAEVLAEARSGQRGCAMSFGPGLTAETMLFRAA